QQPRAPTRPLDLLRRRDPVPGVAVLHGERPVGRHPRAQRLLRLAPAGEERRVGEQLEEAVLALEIGLDPAERPARLPRLLRPAPAVRVQGGDALVLERDPERPLEVALVLVLRHRAAAVRAARVPDDEHQVTLFRTRRTPRDPVLGMSGMTVLVDAEEREV